MQRCGNCNVKFKYRQFMESGFNGYQPVVCAKCDVTHKVTVSSRIRISLCIIIYPLLKVFDVINRLRDHMMFFSFIVFLAMITTLLMFPYLIRVKIVK